MFIEKPTHKRIKLTKDLTTWAGTYTKGHEFNIIGLSNRGLDLEDDDGRRILETGLFISFKYID